MKYCCFSFTSERRKKGPSSLPAIEGHLLKDITHFSFIQLKSATENFNASCKIGRGGFGTVYQGTLKDGTHVAVKRLSAQSKQGLREFLTEINTISNLKHPNLVQLIGCCVEGPNRILVYEYLENNSLDHALLGYGRRKNKINWRQRSEICLGAARGLAFLHEETIPHIVHRDIKASNILLDENFHPKIGDFGLARLFPNDISHISTKIAGTTGYLAPEYALGGQLTKKADVYSFGVLLLEIISGRSSTTLNWGGTSEYLLEWTWELYEEGELLQLVDHDLDQYPEEEVLRYIKVALFCTQLVANRRPLMSQVVKMLSKNMKVNERELTPPGFFRDSMKSSGFPTSSMMSSTYDSSYGMTFVPVAITQLSPR